MLALIGAALARTWIVDQEGCGDFETIEAAFAAVSDGDTIRIRPGVYQMGTYVFTEADGVTIEGVDRDTTIIDGTNGPEIPFRLSLNNTVRNLTFRDFHGDYGPIDISASGFDGGQHLIENVTIENSVPPESEDEQFSGLWANGNVDVTLRNVRIAGYQIGFVPYVWTRSVTVESSIFENRQHGIFTLNTSTGFCGESIVIDHSLFMSGRYGVGIASHDDYACEHPDASITNNVFVGFSELPFGASAGIQGFADNNIVLGPEVEIEPYDLTITNTIFVDSGFIAWSDDDDYTNDDFHLVVGSAAVDAAVAWVTPSGTDAEGRPRPIDGDGDGVAVADIGPFELDPADPGGYDDGSVPVDTGDCVDTADTADTGDTAVDTADTDTGMDSASDDTEDMDGASPIDTGEKTTDGCGCGGVGAPGVAWVAFGALAVRLRRRRARPVGPTTARVSDWAAPARGAGRRS